MPSATAQTVADMLKTVEDVFDAKPEDYGIRLAGVHMHQESMVEEGGWMRRDGTLLTEDPAE